MKDVFMQAWKKVSGFFSGSGWKILLVLCVLIIAFCLIRLFVFAMKKILYKTKIDNAVVTFIGTLVTLVLWVLVVLLIAQLLEISLSSIVVALGSVALAIGLALKESLANLANGILIIFNKPFRRGDYVEVENVAGKIYNIRLLTTEIMTVDNKKIVVPNSFIVNNPVVNFNAAPTRRVDKKYTVHYDSDMSLVDKTLICILTDDKRVLRYPAPSVFVSGHGESSVEFTVRFWVNTPDFWEIYNALDRIVFDKFKENGIQIPYNQLDVHMIGENASKRTAAKTEVSDDAFSLREAKNAERDEAAFTDAETEVCGENTEERQTEAEEKNAQNKIRCRAKKSEVKGNDENSAL